MALKINGREIDINDPESIKRAFRALRFGYLFIAAGIAFLCLWPMERFICERSSNLCEFQRRHLWETNYVTKKYVAVSDITNAYVNTYHRDENTAYQVFLASSSGEWRLFSGYSSWYDTHAKRAGQINHFLKSQDALLEIRNGDAWFVCGLALFFIFIGSLFAIYIPRRLKRHLKELEKSKPILPSRTREG